ncbi:hypothetical protein CPC08DRAFT_764924 [Agrocybe pediades]|nr:hypothetical protein CPC08DRAFT_764924 [Agrocybe pediades]
MQFKTVAATLALGATLAAATGIPAGQCSTGPIQCCASTGHSDDTTISKLLGLLGVVVQDVTFTVWSRSKRGHHAELNRTTKGSVTT